MPPRLAVIRITGFDLRVRDPQRSRRFYREALGFADAAPEGDDPCVRLGDMRLRLVATPADAMPSAPAATDAPDFQHFAVRVSDMAAAHASVAPLTPRPITRGGPQRLPPADGSVTAWKFRDPDGHPLELLQFASPAPASAPLFQAIDHTALACADPAASRAFYERLGFTPGPSSHNHGAQQDRLDGLAGVDLRIATLHTTAAGPHIELLHYVSPSPPGAPARSGEAFVRTRLLASDATESLVDPDGHRLHVLAQARPG